MYICICLVTHPLPCHACCNYIARLGVAGPRPCMYYFHFLLLFHFVPLLGRRSLRRFARCYLHASSSQRGRCLCSEVARPSLSHLFRRRVWRIQANTRHGSHSPAVIHLYRRLSPVLYFYVAEPIILLKNKTRIIAQQRLKVAVCVLYTHCINNDIAIMIMQ